MKNLFRHLLLFLTFSLSHFLTFSQNIGVGTAAPQARLHIKGEINASELLIDADTNQTIQNPMIRLRKSNGTDALWITSHDKSNIFLGVNAGRNNESLNNIFIGEDAGYAGITNTQNIGIGTWALKSNTSNANTALGTYSLAENTSGFGNTALGALSMNSNTIGTGNTAAGYSALNNNTDGNNNSAFGYLALKQNNQGDNNTASGYSALYNNSSGNNNTAIGYQSMYANTTGGFNTAVGQEALMANTMGGGNTAVGSSALVVNTIGDDNTAIGRSTLSHNSTGIRNTALGGAVLTFNTDGDRNTACGHYALHYNSVGNHNSALGNEALYNNTTGNYNTAIGKDALHDNTTGNDNSAIGSTALFYNTTGYLNTAIGAASLWKNTTGYYNIGIGSQALLYNTTGYANIAIGRNALLNTNGSSGGNIGIGYRAGEDYDHGSDNTFIGNSADANAAGYSNSTGLGTSATVTGSNQVRIGAGVTSIGGPQSWTNYSNARIKTNVATNVPGLDFINLLQPVTYNKSLQLENEIIGRPDSLIQHSGNPYANIRYSGFIAQDVEAAAQSIGYDFSGVDAPLNDKSLYGLRYAEFVVPLVKAVQELSDENVKLQTELDLIRSEMAAMSAELQQIKKQLED